MTRFAAPPIGSAPMAMCNLYLRDCGATGVPAPSTMKSTIKRSRLELRDFDSKGHGFSPAVVQIYLTLSFRAKLNPPQSGGFNAVEEPAVCLQRPQRPEFR